MKKSKENTWISPYENQKFTDDLLIDDGINYHLGRITQFGAHVNNKGEIIWDVKRVMILSRK